MLLFAPDEKHVSRPVIDFPRIGAVGMYGLHSVPGAADMTMLPPARDTTVG